MLAIKLEKPDKLDIAICGTLQDDKTKCNNCDQQEECDRRKSEIKPLADYILSLSDEAIAAHTKYLLNLRLSELHNTYRFKSRQFIFGMLCLMSLLFSVDNFYEYRISLNIPYFDVNMLNCMYMLGVIFLVLSIVSLILTIFPSLITVKNIVLRIIYKARARRAKRICKLEYNKSSKIVPFEVSSIQAVLLLIQDIYNGYAANIETAVKRYTFNSPWSEYNSLKEDMVACKIAYFYKLDTEEFKSPFIKEEEQNEWI